MKKYFSFFVPVIAMLIVSVSSIRSMAQPDPPPLPDQHGNFGDQSPQGAPLDGGSEVLLFLGIVYAVKKVTERKRETIIER
jgi:hypothetical protein